MEELIDVGLLLDRQPAPCGRRLALVGNAGGPLLLGADAAGEAGADVPVLSAELQRQLADVAPGAVSWANPVDAGPSAAPESLAGLVRDDCRRRVRSTRASSSASSSMSATSMRRSPSSTRSTSTCRSPSRRSAEGRVSSDGCRGSRLRSGRRRRWPWRAVGRSGSRRTPLPGATGIGIDAAPLIATRRLARRLAGDEATTTWLGQDSAFELLETTGVGIASWCYARSAEECARGVRRLAGRCVLKADVAGVLHKTEEGAVRLGVADVDSAADVYREFERLFGERLNGVVVQSQVPAGLELSVGATRDPAFGPFVAVGAGGVEAEVRADRAVLVAPVTAAEARDAVEGLHLAPLFHGFRGRPELPVEAVVELVTTDRRVDRRSTRDRAARPQPCNRWTLRMRGRRRHGSRCRHHPLRSPRPGPSAVRSERPPIRARAETPTGRWRRAGRRRGRRDSTASSRRWPAGPGG